MKINKIVAAGAAATLAVTSLASVASAKNPRSWSLVYNYGVLTATPQAYDRGFNDLTSVDVDSRIFATGNVQANIVNTKGGITEAYNLSVLAAGSQYRLAAAPGDALADGHGTIDGVASTPLDRANTNADGAITDADFDAVIPVYIGASTDTVVYDSDNNKHYFTDFAGKLSIVVSGRKRDNTNFVGIQKKTEIRTDIASIKSNGNPLNLQDDSATAIGAGETMFSKTIVAGERAVFGVPIVQFAYIPLFATSAPEGYLMPSDFDAVDNIKIDVSGMQTLTGKTDDKDLFYIEKDFVDTGWNYDWLNYNLVATATGGKDNLGADFIMPLDTKYKLDDTTWYDPAKLTPKTWTGKADWGAGIPQGASGRIYVRYEVPDLYAAGSAKEADTADDDSKIAKSLTVNHPYKSAIQLTANSTRDGDNNLIMTGEYIVSGLGNDVTRGGIAVPAKKYEDNTTNIKEVGTKRGASVGNLLIEKIADLVHGTNVQWRITSAELMEANAWLPKTDIFEPKNTLTRNEIWLLSDTNEYQSLGQRGWSISRAEGDGATQTYEVEDYRKGTQPLGFAGLASQVADYFNKELNGTITFTFADVANMSGRGWLNGGIPSTEVGLRNVLSGATPDDFALYFNYATTTGSLETVVDIDVDQGEVTFDISNLLDQLGGYTIGTIHDIYYGMTKAIGLRGTAEGMWVSQVTLRAEDSADVSPATEDDDVTVEDDDDDVTVEDDDDDVAIEDDDDVAIEDDDDVAIEDDDDVAIEDDDDIAIEDDDDTAGEVEVVSGDDDDANPHTGVALAVVPALVAAAAIVVSKKRK